MSLVTRVDDQEIADALARLEAIDLDAANALRAYLDGYAPLFQSEMLDLRELLLELEGRIKDVATHVHELAMGVERASKAG